MLTARNPSLAGLLGVAGTAVFALAVTHYGIGTGYDDHATYAPRDGAT
jgi:hypothetical protein